MAGEQRGAPEPLCRSASAPACSAFERSPPGHSMAPKKTPVDKDGFRMVGGGFIPGPNHDRCTLCSNLDHYANSPLQGFWYGPSHNGHCPRAGCSFVAKPGANKFSSTVAGKAAAAAKAPPSPTTPSVRSSDGAKQRRLKRSGRRLPRRKPLMKRRKLLKKGVCEKKFRRSSKTQTKSSRKPRCTQKRCHCN